MGQIKVVHVVPSFMTGGMENGMVNLINRMDPISFYHIICCLTKAGPISKNIVNPNVEICELNKAPGKNNKLLKRLFYFFKKKSPDIVHTRNWGGIDGIIPAKLAGVKVIIHGEHGRDINDPKGELRRRLWARRLISPLVNKYLTVSEDMSQWLVNTVRINPKKVMTIVNGVDTEKFSPENAALIRNKYGVDKFKFLIGTVGRLDPIKDQATLIKAFAILAQSYKFISLLIIGDGPCRKELESLVDRLNIRNHVSFWGELNNVADIYKLLDVFALSSIGEGMSNTILEAMATGIPVVATDVGGSKELISDSKNGFLVPPQDPYTLANCLEKYIENPDLKALHGNTGRKLSISLYNMPKMVSQYSIFYMDQFNARTV